MILHILLLLSVADPDLELGGRGRGVGEEDGFLNLPCRLYFLLSFRLFFLPKIRKGGGGRPLLPLLLYFFSLIIIVTFFLALSLALTSANEENTYMAAATSRRKYWTRIMHYASNVPFTYTVLHMMAILASF